MKKTILVIGLLVLPYYALYAQDNQEFIQNITKNYWQGKGMLMGVSATFQMDWELVLNNQFLKLNFSSTRQGADGNKITFSAHGYYKINESNVVGSWFDSRGSALPLTGEINENELIVFWESNNTERGKTIYTLVNENKVSVKDYILQNNDYMQFGEANYTSVEKDD